MVRPALTLLFAAYVTTSVIASEYKRTLAEGTDLVVSAAAADSHGNLYVLGGLTSANGVRARRVGSGGKADTYLTKLNARGTIAWSVLLGGSGDDGGHSVAVDRVGNVVVVGYTTSTNFPVRRAMKSQLSATQDGFITKFDALGRLVFSTYLGASNSYLAGVAMDTSGDIYVTGSTANSFLPLPGVGVPVGVAVVPVDALVARISRNGRKLFYAHRFGGSGHDWGNGIAVNRRGVAVVVGHTSSHDFPFTNYVSATPQLAGTSASFLATVGPDGSAGLSTLIPQRGMQANELKLDRDGNIYVAGITYGPLSSSEADWNQRDGYAASLLKLSPDGTNIVAARHFEMGFGSIAAEPLAVTPDGTAFIGATHATSYNGEQTSGLVVRVAPDGATDVLPPDNCQAGKTELLAVAANAHGSLFQVSRQSDGSIQAAKFQRARTLPAPPARVLLYTSLSNSIAPDSTTVKLKAAPVAFKIRVGAVHFYSGEQLIGTDTTPPFEVKWGGATQPTQTFRAVAETSGGNVESCHATVSTARPPNDDFTNAIALGGSAVQAEGTTRGATFEVAEEGLPTSPRSVWYSWTAATDGFADFSFSLSPDNHVLAVFTGTNLSSLTTEFATEFHSDANITLPVRAGRTFHVAVGSYGEGRTFRLNIRPAQPPANDSFENRFSLAGVPVATNGTLRDATAEPTPPGSFDVLRPTVWYEWTAPASGFYSARAGTGYYRPDVAVYRGERFEDLVPIFGANSTVGTFFEAQAGAAYQVRVSSWYNHSPDFMLEFHAAMPPANDHFTNRITLSGAVISSTTTTTLATREPGEPLHGGNFSYGGSVWWSWSPPSSGEYLFTAEGVAGLLAVYTGETLSSLARVASNSASRAALRLNATAGVTYQIAFEPQGFSGQSETVVLGIRPHVPPLGDNFANALLLTNNTTVALADFVNATLEPGELFSDSRWPPVAGSLWYRFVAPTNGAFFFRVSPDFAHLSVTRGDSLYDLDISVTGQSVAVMELAAGEEVRLRIGSDAQYGRNVQLGVTQVELPPNDRFANRTTVVAGTDYPVSATYGSFEPGEDYRYGYGSVWFRWVAPHDGYFAIESVPSGLGVAVYQGNALSNLTPISSGIVGIHAEAGVEYAIALYSYPYYLWASHIYTWRLQHVPPPANDDFANAIALAGERLLISANVDGSTTETNEPPAGAGQTLWWSWTAPHSGRVLVRNDNVYTTPRVNVYTGNALGNLTSVTGADLPFEFHAEQGVTYFVRLDAVYDFLAGTEYSLRIILSDAPGNDMFAHRFITDGEPVSGTTLGATLEEGEPRLPGELIVPGGGVGAHRSSVWWSWQAPSDGTYEFRLTQSGTDYSQERTAHLYAGDSLTNLVPLPTAKFDGLVQRFRAAAGQSYSIAISSDNGRAGRYTFHIARVPTVPNDDFADRIPLAGTNVTFSGATRHATIETGEAEIVSRYGGQTVWWTWTAPADGTVTIEMLRGNSHWVGVFAGTTLQTLDAVDGSGASSFWFSAAAGTTYHIAVDSWFNPSLVDTTFEIRLQLHPPPNNDLFANRFALSGTNVQTTGSAFGATAEPNEPAGMNHSVWWSWIVPETGRYTIEVMGTNVAPRLAVFAGTSFNELTALCEASGNYGGRMARVNYPFSAGDEIAIAVDAPPASPIWPFDLRIRMTSPPINDAFANRLAITNNVARGTTEGASREAGEYEQSYDATGEAVWWEWTAPISAWTDIETTVSLPTTSGLLQPQVEFGIYTGTALTNLVWIARVGRWPLVGSRFYAHAGVTYLFNVGHGNADVGEVTLTLRPRPAPPNDYFTNATVVSGETIVLVTSNIFASAEISEPYLPGRGENSVWWQWIAPNDGVYLLSASSSAFTPYPRLYTGTNIAELQLVHGVGYGAQFPDTLFRADAGRTYFISVASFAHYFWHEGEFTLTLKRVTPPPNDHFANRTTVTGSHASVNASNTFATPEAGDPLTNALGQQTVWWRWVAPASGTASLHWESPRYLAAAVYRGDALSNLVEVTNASGAGPHIFFAEAGVEYAIGATTYSDYATEFTLEFTGPVAVPVPAPARPSLHINATRGAVLETSPDLRVWRPVRTNASGAPGFVITPDASEPQRFYRVR